MGASDASQLPEPVRRMLQAELQPGESIRWLAQPIPKRLAMTSLPIVLFAVPWTAFAVFWVWGAANSTCSSPSLEARLFPLFGVPFVLVGLGMFASPFWLMRAAKRTVYAVSDRRALVVSQRWSLPVRSFEPEKLCDLRRDQHGDGSGNLVFGQDIVATRNGSRAVDYGFMAVPNVREAEEFVRALARSAPRS
jgi:hypothetical protein